MACGLSTWLPLLSAQRHVVLRYALPAALAAVAFSISAALVVVCLVVVLLTRWSPVVDAVRSRRWVTGGRALAITLVVVSLPNTISNVADIAGR